MFLSKEDKKEIYKAVMEAVAPVVKKRLMELSQQTIDSAADKSAKRNQFLLNIASHGVAILNGDKVKIDPEALKKFLEDKNPKFRERIMKMYKDGSFGKYLIQQKHNLTTMSHSKMEWFRDNTDVPLSPEFFVGMTDSKRPQRKPTKEEDQFYKYFTSMGQDTEGLTPEQKKRFRDAFCRYYDEAQGMSAIWDMVPEN